MCVFLVIQIVCQKFCWSKKFIVIKDFLVVKKNCQKDNFDRKKTLSEIFWLEENVVRKTFGRKKKLSKDFWSEKILSGIFG